MEFGDIGKMMMHERLLRGWSIDEAAERAGVPADELRRIEDGEGDVGQVIADMEHAFTILSEAGINGITIDEKTEN